MGCCGACCEGILRFILFIFNMALLAAGLALLIVGGIASKEFQDFASANLFESRYLWGPVALAIVVGVLLVLVGFFGIGGLCCKNSCMLKAFIVFLLLLIILEITVMVLAFVYKDEGKRSAKDGIRNAMEKAYGSQHDTKTLTAMNKLQSQFKCCGSYNYTDYAKAYPQPLPIPEACCKDRFFCPDTVYLKGCSTALFDAFQKYTVGIFVVCIVFVIIQIIGLIMAIKFLKDESASK